RQKDFSRGQSVEVTDAWRRGRMDSHFERPFLGVVRDIAVLHKSGIGLSAGEELLASWIFYKKPNGKIDRAIVDYGAIVLNCPESSIKHNFSILLPLLKAQKEEVAIKALKTYFSVNPNKALESMANGFFPGKF
ncbi:MAG: hypothetical protein NTY48_01540, partial [Candidatus Diapherotrites archaeon]|nr:hypothetical protein [Candidatus Diapherotrites archaeon]